MPLLNVNPSSDVQFVGNPITLHFMELQGLQSSLTSPPVSVSMHAAPASENTQHGEPTTTPTLPSSFASNTSENGIK